MSPKTITIHSEKLANALRAVVYCYTDQSLIGRPLSFEEPYKFLFHHFADLETYRSSQPAQHSNNYRDECNKDIDLLLEVIDREEPGVAEEKDRYKGSPPVCTFNLLWLLFKPGEACYRTSETGEISAYIVRAITGDSSNGGPSPYRIYMWQINFNGYQIGRHTSRVVVASFGGGKNFKFDFWNVSPAYFVKIPRKN